MTLTGESWSVGSKVSVNVAAVDRAGGGGDVLPSRTIPAAARWAGSLQVSNGASVKMFSLPTVPGREIPWPVSGLGHWNDRMLGEPAGIVTSTVRCAGQNPL